jgi:RHS repeat-associated protein
LALPNLHGDIIVTTDGNGIRQGPATNYTPYGQATTAPETTTGTTDAGWLGQYGKLTDHTSGTTPVTDMGARPYRADLGRFLSNDPIEGGCANKYVYVFGDPVNKNDVNGKDTSGCVKASLGFVAGMASYLGGVGGIALATAAAGATVATGGLVIPVAAGAALVGGLAVMIIAAININEQCFRPSDR